MRSSRRGDGESKKQSEKAYVDYHPHALEELIESARFYELRQEGLGARFLDAIAGALKAVSRGLSDSGDRSEKVEERGQIFTNLRRNSGPMQQEFGDLWAVPPLPQ